MDIIEKFKEAQFNYLKARGFLFFVLQHNKSYRTSHIIYAAKKKPNIKEHSVVDEILNFNDFSKYDLNYSCINVLDPIANKDFFLDYFKNNQKERKQLLRSTWRIMNGFDLKDYYPEILSIEKHSNIQTFIKFFNSCFSVTEWKALRVPLENLHECLLKTWNQDESYLFWLNFFKARKSQTKNHNIAPKVAEFLLETFKDQKQIETFFPFFPFLRAKFETIEADIFENEYEFTTVLSLNLKKMFDTFCITDYSRHSYAEAIKSFMYGVQEFYDLDYVEDVYENRQRGSLHVTFYHNNSNFTFKDGKRLIVDFFNHLKINHPDTLDTVFVVKWLEFDQLNNSLKIKPNNHIQKVKKI